MTVKFDYTQVLQNSALFGAGSSLGVYEAFVSTAPFSSEEVFRGYINPGHQNNADWLQYNFNHKVNHSGSSFQWEMQPRGSTVWTVLSSYQLGSTHADGHAVWGLYDTSAIALPVVIRLKVSSTKSDISNTFTFRNSGIGMSAIRVVGDIAT